MGIFCREYYTFIKKYTNIILLISTIIFGICLPFWKGEYYGIFFKVFSWKTMQFDFSNITTGLYRILIGVSGSMFFFTMFNKIYYENTISKHLSKYGQYTLEIYILQVIVIETILTRIIDFPSMNMWLYSLVITPIIAIIVFIFCIIIIKLIKKNKYINILLFGRK
jgi:fucose 4-O-acetylase-like acetyltransferase